MTCFQPLAVALGGVECNDMKKLSTANREKMARHEPAKRSRWC